MSPEGNRAPRCPSCGEDPGRGRVFCTICWSDVPAPARRALERASKAMGLRPASRRVREDYARALSAAAGYVT